MYNLDIVLIINLLFHSIILTKCSVGNFEIIKGIPIESKFNQLIFNNVY